MNRFRITCWAQILDILVEDPRIADFILSLKHISGIPAEVQTQDPSNDACSNNLYPSLHIRDRSKAELVFTPQTRTLTMYIRWDTIDHSPSTLTNILGQLLSLACVNSGEFPLHSAVVCKDRNAYLIIGDSGAGKTNLSISLCKKAGFQWLANDWSAIRIENDEALVVRGYDLIDLRKLGFQQIERYIPESIAHHIESEFRIDSDMVQKSAFFTSDDLGLSRGTFPTPVAGIFFVQLAPGTDFRLTRIKSLQLAHKLLREFFWPLRGLGSFVIDNTGKVILPSVVLTPSNGWGEMCNLVDLLTGRHPCYSINSSLEAACKFVSQSTVN